MVTPIFFYGRLRDRGLLEVVLGRAVAAADAVPARLAGAAVRRGAGEGPVLVPVPGEVAEGVLLVRPTEADLARLAWFLAPDGVPAPVNVATAAGVVAAQAFRGGAAPDQGVPGAGAWGFADWQRGHGAAAIEAAREYMGHFGRLPAERAVALRRGIRTRALQRVRAMTAAPRRSAIRTPFAATDVEVRSVSRAYTSFFAVQELRLRHKRFDGGWSDELARSAVLWGDAVTILPYDARRDRVLLIEQFRAGPTARGDRNPWCIEVVAGLIDRPESAEATARREAREEAGLEIGRIDEIGRFYSTPGTGAEFVTSFVGEAALPEAGGLYGEADEHEDIRTMVLGFDQAMAAVADGAVNTSPALLALLWLAANRERLRRDWGAE